MDMTTEEKLLECDRFRLLGNRMYEQGKFQRAASFYHRALVYFEYMFPETKFEIEEHDRLRTMMLLNFAACHLKMMQYDDVIHNTAQLIRQNPRHVKALYMRAKAYRFRDEFDKSICDIKQAIDIVKGEESEDSIVHLLLRELHLTLTKQLAYRIRMKKISKAMFAEKARLVGSRGNVSHNLYDPKPSRLDKSSDHALIMSQPIMHGMEELYAIVQELEGQND